MSSKVAEMLDRIRAELSLDEIRILQKMLDEAVAEDEGKNRSSLEDNMRETYREQLPCITAENYQNFERDSRFQLISKGMAVLEDAERKEDWEALRKAKEDYPRAAAFISALLVATAAAPERHAAGIRAMDRLLNEDPVDEVTEELWRK